MATEKMRVWRDGVLIEDRDIEVPAERTNERLLRNRADQAITAMQAHVDRGTFTATQRDQALVLVLRVCIALTRLVLGRLDSPGS